MAREVSRAQLREELRQQIQTERTPTLVSWAQEVEQELSGIDARLARQYMPAVQRQRVLRHRDDIADELAVLREVIAARQKPRSG